MIERSFGKETGIRITTGFFIQFITLVLGFAGLYYNMKAELSEAREVANEARKIVAQQDAIVRSLQIELSALSRSYSDFRVTYEQDMNRWIREPRAR